LITKDGHGDRGIQAKENIHCLESGHPLPDQRSLEAGQLLLSFMAKHGTHCDFIFLISGGASSLVEVLPEGVSLDDWRRMNDWLLGSGWDIARMNQLRKSVSCIKGGRLARHLSGRKALCLMISDVPGNLPQVIGSGFLAPPLIAETPIDDLPAWIKQLPRASAAPLATDACFANVDIRLIATLENAMGAAAKVANNLGYRVELHEEIITGNAQAVGQQLAQQLCQTESVLHIWGGETTVQLPPNPGRGGRNQHLALAAAIELAGHDNCYFLAGATDGSDGPTHNAGALVDGKTVERGRRAGFEVRQTLAQADAGAFLQASGDLITTGPTGTNVMDLLLALHLPADSESV